MTLKLCFFDCNNLHKVVLNACTMLVTYRCKMSRCLTITGSTVIIKLFLPMEPLYSVTTILRWVNVRMGQV